MRDEKSKRSAGRFHCLRRSDAAALLPAAGGLFSGKADRLVLDIAVPSSVPDAVLQLGDLEKRPKWKPLRKFLWVVCWFVLFAVFEWFIDLLVPRAVWEAVGDARIPAVFPTLGLGCSFGPWLEEW